MLQLLNKSALWVGVLLLMACGATVGNGVSPQEALPVVTRAGTLIVRDAWSRPTAAGSAGQHANHGGAEANGINGVIYLSIENVGTSPEQLISVGSTRSANITLHQTVLRDGLFEMVPLPNGIIISPAATITLKPAGLHLMVSDVQPPFLANETYSLTLRFASGLEITVPVKVRPF